MSPDEKSAFDKVEFQAHNYFDAFMLRRCLHNNSDPECIKILRAFVPGVVNGGPAARLLIN